MKEIDLTKWNRESHFRLFGEFLQPCFRIDVRLDVTKLMKNKEKLGGAFVPLCYLITRAINRFDGGRIRQLNDGKVVIFDKVLPSFTVSLDDGNFAFVSCDYTENYGDFLRECKKSIELAKTQETKKKDVYFTTNNRADLIYLSCLPWLDVVSIENPLPLGEKLAMSIPRINWGKIVQTESGYFVTLSATFNHGLIDGREASSIMNELIFSLENIEDVLLKTIK